MNSLTADYDKQIWVHYQAAIKVARLLNKAGFDAYLIGGAVRDILLGQLPKDFDLVTNARPEQIHKLKGIERAKYNDPAQAFGVSRVRVEIAVRGETMFGEVEIATYRRDIEAHLGRAQTKIEFAELADDIARRDFTVNGLALDLANDYLVDLVDGLNDLEAKRVRFIGEPQARITEDPLRVMRGLRLKVQYGFSYEPQTRDDLKKACSQGAVDKIATERLQTELSRMLTHPTRRQAVEELDEFGLIQQLLPELARTKRINQPQDFHAEGDVWTHTLLAISNLPGVVSTRLAWATLLHDIGKPATFVPAEKTGDRIRFSQHYQVGAQMAEKILTRFKFSKKFIQEVSWMINNHMGIDDLPKMRIGRAQNFMSHPAFADLLALHQADAQASWHPGPSGKPVAPRPDFSNLQQLYTNFLHQQTRPTLKSEFGIDGHWLKNELGLKDGHIIGRVLKQLNEAYLDGDLTSVSQAKKLANKFLSSNEPAK